MPRNPKHRKVCRMPLNYEFHSRQNENIKSIQMTVDEYETIRLIDYLSFTQEECARQMHVARTTVQRIYNDARKKLSAFLVEGMALNITGGNYELCKNQNCGGCKNQCLSAEYPPERKD